MKHSNTFQSGLRQKWACCALAFLLAAITPSRADLTVDGDATLNFTRILDGQGNVTGYNYTGASSVSLTYNVPFITVGIGILPLYRDGQPHFWSEVHIWDDLTLPITNAVAIFPAVAGAGAGSPSLHGFFDVVDTLTNAGPTEKNISTPLKVESPDIAGFHVEFGIGLTVKFDATLNSGAHLLLDQTAVLEKLTVNSGATLTANSSLGTRTDLLNHGLINNLGGTVEGNFLNDGTATGAGAFISSNFSVQGNFTNTGKLEIESGGSLTRTAATTNGGSLILNGGTINVSGGLTNSGNLDWIAGSLNSNLTNQATMLVRGASNTKSIGADITITNSGVTYQTESAALTFAGIVSPYNNSSHPAVLKNQAGATYDLQGDGSFLSPVVPNISPGIGTIKNAGVFRKSSGIGTSVVESGIAFNNTGTVEVDSGTLELQGGGSSTNGSFSFANGAKLSFTSNSFSFAGTNSLTGTGVLNVAGGNVSGPISSSGLQLVVSSGIVNSNGGTTSFSGGARGYFSGGSIGGDGGGVINANELEWSAGRIFGGGGLTNTSLYFLLMGAGTKMIDADSPLNNSGAIYQSGGAALTFAGIISPFNNSSHPAVLNNQAGATYDLEGDGSFLSPVVPNISPGIGTINNAGVFRKSSGTGTSVVESGIAFNNTGTVEVDSGTLELQGSGSSTNGSFSFINPANY